LDLLDVLVREERCERVDVHGVEVADANEPLALPLEEKRVVRC
jgi:hypothetical protein